MALSRQRGRGTLKTMKKMSTAESHRDDGRQCDLAPFDLLRPDTKQGCSIKQLILRRQHSYPVSWYADALAVVPLGGAEIGRGSRDKSCRTW